MDVLSALAYVAERKIEEAIAEGQFDNLPGMGKPLDCEDLSHLPPDMRLAYRILKSSGFIEKEPEPGKAVSMRELLSEAQEEKKTYSKLQRFKLMMSRVERAKALPHEPGHRESGTSSPEKSTHEDSPYLEKLLNHL